MVTLEEHTVHENRVIEAFRYLFYVFEELIE